MLKTVKRIIKQHKEKYRVPKSVHDYIHVDEIWNDGIFRKGSTYSKTYRFDDINYISASEPNKKQMRKKYEELLDSLDSEGFTKLTIKNRKLSNDEYNELVRIPLQGDELDVNREELNNVYLERIDDSNCIIQDRYLTVTVYMRNIREAKEYFKRTFALLNEYLSQLGSKCYELNTMERLKILHNFYRPDEENDFHFDYEDMRIKGHSFKDYISPDSFEKHSDYVVMGDRYVRVMYLKDYSTELKDKLIQDLLGVNKNTMLSVDIIAIPTDEAVQYVQQKSLGVETEITNWQRRQNNNNNFSAEPPQQYVNERFNARDIIDYLTLGDQRMMQAVLTIMITADSKEQLDSDTKAIQRKALGHSAQVAILRYQQMDGINTVLPVGARKINTFRTMLTNNVAKLMPFKSQEIMEKGGMFLGINAVSNNPIICNRANLMNQSALVFGVPGSGKSFFVKLIIYLLILMGNDDILVCDPESEYIPLARLLGKDASVIKLMAGGKDRINAMELSEDSIGKEEIVIKSQFILSLFEQMDDIKLTAAHKSIVDRCVRLVYKEAKKQNKTPTLDTLREMLAKQKEPAAHELALALELYTKGSLDIFGGESNVELNKRMLVFDIHELSEHLKPAGLLVIIDTILNRVYSNKKKGKRTHIIIDEFHIVLSNGYSANFFDAAWRQFRKHGGYPIAVTQNFERMFDSPQARAMVANSEFITMFNQATNDKYSLQEFFDLSPEQVVYVTNAKPGCGLFRYGGSTVPFRNQYPKDTILYSLMTTKLGEGEYSGQV